MYNVFDQEDSPPSEERRHTVVHIGIDMHKRFSEVAALDDVGKVISRQKLYHDDRTSLV